MKKFVIAAATVAMLSAITGSVMAAEKVDKATAYCEKMAKKHHITADKMDSYMKSCVDKHNKSHKKAAAKPMAAKPAADPATAAPAAGK